MLESVAKIKLIEIYPSTVCIFFSMYLYKKVYFRSRIILINNKQEEELMKRYITIILKKMGFREKISKIMSVLKEISSRNWPYET